MRKRTYGFVFVAVAAVAVGGGSLMAGAAGPVKVNAYNQMRFDQIGGSTASWQTSSPSDPLDTNTRAIVTVVTPGNYADAYTRASLHINKAVGQVKNLSYDFQADKTAGGDPRISVIFANGDVAYLNAQFCNQPLAASSYTWSRADFTGSTTTNSAPCSFMDNHGATYASTATTSAWQAYVSAHPGQIVVQTVFVLDYPPNTGGSYAVDRISLGTGWMYHAYSNHADKCPTEAAC